MVADPLDEEMGRTSTNMVILGLKVHLAFGKTLEAGLTEVLVRSVANPRALLTLAFRSLSNGFASEPIENRRSADSKSLADLAFLGAFGARQALLTLSSDLSGPG